MERVTVRVDGHAPIHLAVDERSGLSAEMVARYFVRQLHAGVKFEADQTVQIGASLILLRVEGDALAAVEPTYHSMPIVWTPGITRTLRDLTLQKALCAEMQTEAEFPSIRQSLVAQLGYATAPRLVFERDVAPAKNDSGWLVRSADSESEDATLVSIYEAVVQQPQLAPFLALPVGASVAISTGS